MILLVDFGGMDVFGIMTASVLSVSSETLVLVALKFGSSYEARRIDHMTHSE